MHPFFAVLRFEEKRRKERKTMDQDERIRRIAGMEEKMDAALAAAAELERALEHWERVQPALSALAAYYDGGDWLSDYTEDEAGLLPEDLKRGVLSEDGLFDLLDRARELQSRLAEETDAVETE